MSHPGLFNIILRAGLLAGTLDILAAILILAKGKAVATLKFVASGVFGKAAFSGGAGMVLSGAVFHYFIATSFAAGYFLAYPSLPFLQKNKWLSGILYGVIVWTVMNLLVVPLSNAPQSPFAWDSALKNMAILIVCIGLPIAWLADKFYVPRNSV
jgi:uncharacterized membrane protein YagU involved in acid resistance